MKLRKYTCSLWVALLLGGMSMMACKDVLDTPNQSSLEEEVVFSSPTLAEGAIAGILQSFAAQNSYRGRFLLYYGVNTDTEVYNSLRNITSATEQTGLSNYTTSVDNQQMNTSNNVWAMFYEGIERANLAIRGLRAYGNVESDPRMAQILGEILTLRAVIYNDLLKAWGDVPARFEPVTNETAYLPRSDRDTIYKRLLIDLEEAAELVAWPNQSTVTASSERVNKAFVKGLRARIALAAGGYAQRRNETAPRRSNDPDLAPEKMYEIARKECLDVINSGTCQLQGFEQVWRTLGAEQTRAGLESLWEIPFAEGRGRVIFDLGVRHTTADRHTAQNRGGTNGPNPIMFYEYDREGHDVRRDVSCVPYEWTNGIQVPTSLARWMFGKYRYEWLSRRVTSDNDDGLNWVYMRYADVILMAAEAINELEGPQAAAPYLKMIRDRAFPNHPEKVTAFMQTATDSKEAFFNAIVDERALEFTGEMLRKGDLIRWNLLSTKLQEAKDKLEQLENRQGRYADLPVYIYYKPGVVGTLESEAVQIYGLNHGHTDAAGAALVASGDGWVRSTGRWALGSGGQVQFYWEALFRRDPNQQQFWPIWQVFLHNSNGMLDNSGYNF